MAVKLTDKVYTEGGSPVQGAVAQAILTNGTTTSVAGTDITDTKGIWAFDSGIAGHQADLADPASGYWYDVKVSMGMQYRLRYGAIKAMMSMVYLAQTITLGASQLLDASLAALRIPVKASDPGSSATGQIIFRSDTKVVRVYDGTTWQQIGPTVTTPEALYAGGTQVSAVAVNPVAAGIGWVFCTAAITVTLPPAASTNRPITVAAVTGQSTVASQGGSVIGGSPNLTTGVIQNGVIAAGEAYTYKSDGVNYRAI